MINPHCVLMAVASSTVLLLVGCSGPGESPRDDRLPPASVLPADDGLRSAILSQRQEVGDPKDSEYAEAVGELGRRYHAANLVTAAESCYLLAEESAPNDPTWPHLRGYLNQEQGRLEEAIEAYGRAIALGGDRAVRLRRAEAAFDLGDLELAESDWNAVNGETPGTAAALYGLGRVALIRGEPERAVALLESALLAAPEAGRIRHSLGLALRELGREDSALEQLRAANPTDVGVRDPVTAEIAASGGGVRFALRRGQALLASDPRAALVEFRAAQIVDPENLEVRRNIAIALVRSGQRVEAVGAYLRLIEGDPQDASSWMALGSLLASQGQLADSVARLEEAVRLAPDFKQAKYLLGAVQLQLGRPEEAFRLFDEVLEVDPGYESVRVQRALALLALGRVNEAEGELLEQLRSSPDDIDSLLSLAGLYSEQERSSESARYYQEAVKHRPEMVGVRLGAAQELARSGECRAALSLVREGLAVQAEEADLLAAESLLSDRCGP